MIGRHWHIGKCTYFCDDVKIGDGRLHHDHVGPLIQIQLHLHEGLPGIAPILLIALAIATPHNLYIHRIAERAVQRRGVFHGVGEDGDVAMPRTIQRRADGRHLTIHHAAGSHHLAAGISLGHCGLGVERQGGVIVNVAIGAHNAAMTVGGVLVHAEVGDEHHLLSHLVAQVAQGGLDDAVRVERTGPHLVLVGGHPEQHHSRHAQCRQLRHFLADRLSGVLHYTRQ